MKNWFMNLEPRERNMVSAALALSVFAILYLGLWVPVDKAQMRAANDVELWQRSVDTIRSLKVRIVNDSGVEVDAASLNQPIVVIIDASLRARGLDAPKRSQPTGENIRIEFDAVAFDDMMLWLGDLANRYGLQVQAGSFTRSSEDTPGLVDATLTIGR